MRKRVRRAGMLVAASAFLATATAALPQSASAITPACRAQGLILGPFGGEYGINNTNCVESNGGGYEIAYWSINPPHSGTLAGCYHTQLTDNGYPMANSGEHCDPNFPTDIHDEGGPYGGWTYHPYWGTYCSRVWVNQGSGKYAQAVQEMCWYEDGFQ